MPQMAPLSWLLLFFIFTFSLLLFSTINYFMKDSTPPSSSESSFKSNPFNWKW